MALYRTCAGHAALLMRWRECQQVTSKLADVLEDDMGTDTSTLFYVARSNTSRITLGRAIATSFYLERAGCMWVEDERRQSAERVAPDSEALKQAFSQRH